MQTEMIVYGLIFLMAFAAVFICLRDDKGERKILSPGIGHGYIAKSGNKREAWREIFRNIDEIHKDPVAQEEAKRFLGIKGGYQPKGKRDPGDPPKGGSSAQDPEDETEKSCSRCLWQFLCSGGGFDECVFTDAFIKPKSRAVVYKINTRNAKETEKALAALKKIAGEKGIPVCYERYRREVMGNYTFEEQKLTDPLKGHEKKYSFNELIEETEEILFHAGLDVNDAVQIINKLEKMDFFTAPASAIHHGAHVGGLAEHSLNVASKLAEMTEQNGIQWQKKRSPYIIGLFHDLCKCDQYVKKGELVYGYNDKRLLEGHGEKSVMIASTIMQLTEEEMLCIRYHMGAYYKEDWTGYDLAIKKYASVLYTHTADMIASKLMEG